MLTDPPLMTAIPGPDDGFSTEDPRTRSLHTDAIFGILNPRPEAEEPSARVSLPPVFGQAGGQVNQSTYPHILTWGKSV
jgi:hypothetical protein